MASLIAMTYPNRVKRFKVTLGKNDTFLTTAILSTERCYLLQRRGTTEQVIKVVYHGKTGPKEDLDTKYRYKIILMPSDTTLL